MTAISEELSRWLQGFVQRTLEPAFADPGADPVAQLHGFLDRVLASQRERNCVGGCPMGNLASELSDVHEGFRLRLAEIFSEWRVRLAGALGRGKSRGGFRADFEPARAAQFVVAVLEGAFLMSKVTRDIAVMESCVDELKQHLTLYATSCDEVRS